MDRAVLDAYGWTDIATDCEFILDYEEEDDDSSRRKKLWRYSWPDVVRDEGQFSTRKDIRRANRHSRLIGSPATLRCSNRHCRNSFAARSVNSSSE